ncbi:MAG TPA: hypothetical protein VF384_05625 [Planctomycetota bacterium]
MKLPIPFLLYIVSLGLFGLAGWTVYEMLPLWKDSARQEATNRGQQQAIEALGQGKVRGPTLDWNYAHAGWWQLFSKVNLTGKLPPPPPVEGESQTKKVDPPVEVRPLEEIIELVSLVYDGEANGRGGDTYVIVRYKQGADVKPPEWYMRANMSAPLTAGPPKPADTTPAAPGGRGANRRGNQPVTPQVPGRGNQSAPVTPLPTSMAGREILQKVWVRDDGDPKHGSRLWPTFENIRLVGVSPEAQTAYFVRDVPPPKEGEAATQPKEEALQKTNMHISAELLEELRRLQGRKELVAAERGSGASAPNAGVWVNVPETTVVNGVRQISKKDEERFRDPDELLTQIHVDTYVSTSGKLTGLIVRNVDTKLASTFGISAGEVLLEINGRPVRSRSHAMEIGKNDYKRGVRTFVTKWMADGAVIERTFQAPDR